MSGTDLPKLAPWVPVSVARLAEATPLKNDICSRLLTDPRMKDVWSYLNGPRTKTSPERLHSVDPSGRLDHWGLDDHINGWDDLDEVGKVERWKAGDHITSVKDQSCGAFFISALHKLSINNWTATTSEIEKAAKPWADAAEHCRMATEGLPFGVDLVKFDPDLRRALLASRDHLQGIADMIGQKGNPRVLDKHSNKAPSLARSHVRDLAMDAKALFGFRCLGIVATTVTVGLDLDPPITRKNAEDWCVDFLKSAATREDTPN